MKRRVTEQTVIFISVLKWVFLSTLVGIVVGLSTSLFLKLLGLSLKFTGNHPYSFLLLPLAFFASSLLVTYLAPDAEGHGTEKVIEAIHKKSGKIKALVVPVKLVATIITLAFGGSAGKEGPCAQIGAGLSSLMADIFRFDNSDRKKLVICGISAGFASVFGTPIAGAIFGVEVLIVGGIMYDVLLPSFISGIMAYQISSSMGIKYFYHPITFLPVFNELFFLKVILAGIYFGFCSFFLIELLQAGEKLSSRIHTWKPLKGIIGGAALAIFALLFSQRFLGLGLDTIEDCIEGKNIIWYFFIMKMVFTSITLNFGGSGGIITPIFFIGATSGALFGDIFGLDRATFAAIGFVSLLAGSTNTPIAASIMAVEMFGPKIAPYAAVACVISFLLTGHRSVYPSQILGIKKSASMEVEVGKEIEDVRANFKPRRNSLISLFLKLFRKNRDKDKETRA
jgi:H+/Cl- antiporter ClcA